MPIPFDDLEALSRQNRRQLNTGQRRQRARLGDIAGNIYVRNFDGNRVYVRLPGGVDDNDNVVFNQVTEARIGPGASFHARHNAPVIVRRTDDGVLEIIGADVVGYEAAGGKWSAALLNPGEPQTKFISIANILEGMLRPVSNTITTSTKVGANPLIYDTHGQRKVFAGGVVNHLDLSTHVPAVGEHRVVQTWLDTYNNVLQTTASSAQALTVEIDSTDFDECWSERFNDWMPLQSFRLKNGVFAVTHENLNIDHRQVFNTPPELGFDNSVAVNTRIWDNRVVVTHGVIAATKTVEARGTLVVL